MHQELQQASHVAATLCLLLLLLTAVRHYARRWVLPAEAWVLIIGLVCGLLRLFRRRLPLSWLNLMLLSGLRGPVTAALILTIPDGFPKQHTFQCLAFAMIAFSMIVQPVLIRLDLGRAALPEAEG